ncbi:MAG: hypothetical protein J6B34_02215 [Clostridia bacterium]|nr:hypothetical protein [Clostridia bacterium]
MKKLKMLLAITMLTVIAFAISSCGKTRQERLEEMVSEAEKGAALIQFALDTTAEQNSFYATNNIVCSYATQEKNYDYSVQTTYEFNRSDETDGGVRVHLSSKNINLTGESENVYRQYGYARGQIYTYYQSGWRNPVKYKMKADVSELNKMLDQYLIGELSLDKNDCRIYCKKTSNGGWKGEYYNFTDSGKEKLLAMVNNTDRYVLEVNDIERATVIAEVNPDLTLSKINIVLMLDCVVGKSSRYEITTTYEKYNETEIESIDLSEYTENENIIELDKICSALNSLIDTEETDFLVQQQISGGDDVARMQIEKSYEGTVYLKDNALYYLIYCYEREGKDFLKTTIRRYVAPFERVGVLKNETESLYSDSTEKSTIQAVSTVYSVILPIPVSPDIIKEIKMNEDGTILLKLDYNPRMAMPNGYDLVNDSVELLVTPGKNDKVSKYVISYEGTKGGSEEKVQISYTVNFEYDFKRE